MASVDSGETIRFRIPAPQPEPRIPRIERGWSLEQLPARPGQARVRPKGITYQVPGKLVLSRLIFLLLCAAVFLWGAGWIVDQFMDGLGLGSIPIYHMKLDSPRDPAPSTHRR